MINYNMVLLRPQNPSQKVPENTLMFKVPHDKSKPEIKQYIQKLYGLETKKINTCRFMGKVVRTVSGYKKTQPFKKAWVELPSKVHQFLNYNPIKDRDEEKYKKRERQA